MTGFFGEEDTSIVRGDEPLAKQKKILQGSCEECGLYKTCISPKMPPSGKGKLSILIVAEAPGKVEDEEGTQLVGASGQLLRSVLSELHLDLDRDFWKTNAIICRPKDNATPTPLQIASCRPNLMKTIDELKPKVIIPLGKIAMDSLVGFRMTGRLSGLSMTDWQGCVIPDQELQTYICPTWHPSYILRNGGDEDTVLRKQIHDDIQQAVALAENYHPFYKTDYESECYAIETKEEAINIINEMLTKDVVAFDAETTGRKPYRDGHEIVTVSVSDGLFSYSFPFFDDEAFRLKWKELMQSDVKKVGHNIKFDSLWVKVRGGFHNTESVWPESVVWDTMLAAHIIDNKKKVNLKYQVYKTFGVAGYDNDIDAYIEPVKKEEELYGSNALNRIKEAPLDKLLKYNALDSLFTYKLYEHQLSIVKKKMKKAIEFFTEGSLALAHAEYNGIIYDVELSKQTEARIAKKMDVIEQIVLSSDELKSWDKDKKFRVSAPGDITHLLFDVLGYECTEENKTKTGRPKSDADTLEQYKNIPIVSYVLDWRRWAKAKTTYFEGYAREAVNGLIHTTFNLHNVDSFRSSSDSPNMQNPPKHDDVVARMFRATVKPRKGHRLIEYDYNSLEARIVATYNKDPHWIAYVSDPTTDMHRDMALRIFLKEKNFITDQERFSAKNGFVFPTIYGSWYKNTAKNIWEMIEMETKLHLKKNGITNLDDFTEHMRTIENWFWGDMFPAAYEWKEKTVKEFEKKGYIDSHLGFRYKAPMSINQLLNYQTQGTAFHCLLWAFTNVTKRMEKQRMKSKIISEIHDAMLIDAEPEEEDVLDHLVWLYGTQKIQDEFDWLIVPLLIKRESSDVDGSWADMHDGRMLKE